MALGRYPTENKSTEINTQDANENTPDLDAAQSSSSRKRKENRQQHKVILAPIDAQKVETTEDG